MAGKASIRTAYWDSCVFLAWLTGEKRDQDEEDGLLACANEFQNGRLQIVTSSLTLTEILPSKTSAEAYRKFRSFTEGHPNVTVASADLKVMEIAAGLRDYYVKRRSGLKRLRVPDAIHLATAILYEVDEFHTFDDGKKDKRSVGLLDLSGNVAGHRLIIVRPGMPQRILHLVATGDEDEEDVVQGEGLDSIL